MFNYLFEIFDSQSLFVYRYKKALSVNTKEDVLEKTENAKRYISNLHLHKTKVLLSKRITGFLGFLMETENFNGLYLEYIEKRNELHIRL